jgi:hypothetical protein
MNFRSGIFGTAMFWSVAMQSIAGVRMPIDTSLSAPGAHASEGINSQGPASAAAGALAQPSSLLLGSLGFALLIGIGIRRARKNAVREPSLNGR